MTAIHSMEKDYYKILELPRSASEHEIRVAYKTLALRWHPDRCRRKEEACNRFNEVNEAYHFLMDQPRRQFYDSSLDGLRPKTTGTSPPKRSSKTERPRSDPGRSMDRSSSTKRPRGHRIHSERSEFIKKMSRSDRSDTSSSASSSASSNGEVDGDDWDAQPRPLYTSTVVTQEVPAEWIFPLELTLEELRDGVTHRFKITRNLLSGQTKTTFIDVEVAPGWKAGTRVRFPGIGNEREGLPPQDVVFIIEEAPHDRFVRDGSSLVAKMEMDLGEALTGEGGYRWIQGLDDKWLQLPVPASIVKPGSESRIPGAGMPIRKGGKVVGMGDLIIKWVILVPDDLTTTQRAELNDLWS